MRQKRKYSSHKGDVGKKAENLIQGQFEGSKTMEKCYTDVTEFAIPASTQKLYLSPVLDGFNSEIIAYNLSTSPNLEQVQTMLEQAFTEKHYENTILHSDQGWQYQHDSYHQFLEGKGNRGYLVNHKRVQHLMKYSIYKLKCDRNENILLIKETLARRQRISFKANLKALKQWNSATQM
ncbi:IS3-Spn1 transposase, truncation [Streptococcus pneumoniae]|nr:IS3-Spn1 transposase, truncation [Streptococcus pneumoniae]